MKDKHPIISLIILSFLVGLLWRLEVEYHGWAGLNWLSYFHWAIPVGFGLFLVWANFSLNMGFKRRILINALALIFGVLIYYGLLNSLIYIFASGTSGLLLFMQTPTWKLNVMRYAIFFIVPLIPIGTYVILKLFKKSPKLKFLILAVVGIIASVPLSVFVLDIMVMDHKGGQDLIHSIKSGMLIPFWVFSVGLLIVGQREHTRAHQKT